MVHVKPSRRIVNTEHGRLTKAIKLDDCLSGIRQTAPVSRVEGPEMAAAAAAAAPAHAATRAPGSKLVMGRSRLERCAFADSRFESRETTAAVGLDESSTFRIPAALSSGWTSAAAA